MDKKLQLLAHLYGEAEDAAPLQELLQDSDLKAEYQAMSEAKFWLDHSIAEKPDADVLARIMAAASAGAVGSTVSDTVGSTVPIDRAPAPRRALGLRIRNWSYAATALSVVALVALFLVNRTPTSSFQEAPVAAQSVPLQKLEADGFGLDRDAEPMAEALADEAPAASRSLADSGFQMAGALAPVTESRQPTWEEADALIQYKSRIDQLLEQSEDLSWDHVVPLESLQGAAPTAPPAGLRLNEASSTRSPRGN
ncbi:MAG: hypothetical protein R2834_12315 [Rhodothermales bacterium]